MHVAVSASPDPHDRPTRLTPRQRRQIHRMIEIRPSLYHKLKTDPRSNFLVLELMNRYRVELLRRLQEMLDHP
jgi:hypothetical protein